MTVRLPRCVLVPWCLVLVASIPAIAQASPGGGGPAPKFEVAAIGENFYAVNDHGRTVATIGNRGYIDWILRSPLQDGPLLKSMTKETHLYNTRGLYFRLVTLQPNTLLMKFGYRLKDDGAVLVLSGHGESQDGHFVSDTIATLRTDPQISRYEWDMDTTITCIAREPQKLRWIEYNMPYPSKTGECMFSTPTKQYNCTLMTDRNGVTWKFPHQHTMHYGGWNSGANVRGAGKIGQIQFAKGAIAGFFGETSGSPVVVVNDASQEPDWAICDMDYALHSGARPTGDIQPDQKLHFAYTIKYLSPEDSEKMLRAARPVPLSSDDLLHSNQPRFELGMNRFTDRVKIDRFDDASCFRGKPPKQVWDREVGNTAKGSLRITNQSKEVTTWLTEPPSHIPPQTTLKFSAMIKTKGVEGKGMFMRLKYYTWQWDPTPHVQWIKTLESKPVGGTTNGWVGVEVPELHVPRNEADYALYFEIVLDGKGVAWMTDVDVDLRPAAEK